MRLSFLVLVGLLLAITQSTLSPSSTDISRFALVESLVDHPASSRLTIERTANSNPQPALTVFAAVGYAACEYFLGWRLDTNRERAVYVVTLWTIGSFTVALLLLLLRMYDESDDLTPLLALMVVLGTTLLSFYGTINPQTPTAFLLTWGLWEARRARALLTGLALGACVLVDPVFAIVFGVALAIGFLPSGRAVARYALGALPGLAIWFALHAIATRSVVPPPGYATPTGIAYAFHTLLGQRGFFVYSPLFLSALFSLRTIVRRLARDHLDRCIAFAVVTVIAVQIVITRGYGGGGFGYRHLIPLVAPFAILAPTLWREHPRIFTLLFVPSFLLALLGSYAPWVPSYPRDDAGNPVFVNARFNAGVNLACFCREHRLPGVAHFERWFISPDPAIVQQYEVFLFRLRGDH